ncbi:CRE-SRG-34 protein [Caenorhabditis remanei]|uniref:Serpentine receptor class gamma n=1 Tax=Caenorhabditis remanei TaxID=31234 RepID=E3NB68_CAERE|nr:CRE-SRG-34 protein [Caenorhabditis remanei]
MDLLTNAKFMITTSYGITAMIIYTWVTGVILRNSGTFKSSFFHLFCVGYFMNLCTYLNSFVTLRLPQNTDVSGTFSDFYSSLNLNNTDNMFPLSIFHTLHFEFAYTQYIFNCFVCTNRFTAICFPVHSERVSLVWRQIRQILSRTENPYFKIYFQYWLKYFWVIILSMFLVPFILFTRHILQNRSFFNWSPTANFFIDTTYVSSEKFKKLARKNIQGRSNIYYYLMPSLIILTMINIAFNILAGIKKGVRVPETSLFSMAFTVFVIDLFLTSLTVSNYYLTNMATSLDSELVRVLLRWIPLLTPFASDALTLTHPILLLYFSKTVSFLFFSKKLCFQVRRKCMESSSFLQKFHNHRFFAESNSNVVVVSVPRNINNLVQNTSSNK